ncbi:DNA-formamidopyrimidine glycosylase family protein [Flexivirga sp. B27]
MPEGDVVRRAAQQLDRALRGEELVGCELRWPTLAGRSLHGTTTVEVVSRGKHLLHRFDSGMTLHSHLRMDGRWQLRATARMTPNAVRSKAIRVLLATSQWTAIGYRLGMLDLVDTRDERTLVGHLGPDLLGDDWDPQRAKALLRRQPARQIGAALLDQRNLAGLGTIWTTETLFHEQVNPWAVIADLADERLDAVLSTVHRLLSAAAERPGFEQQVAAYGRAGQPCPRCGRLLRTGPVGEQPEQRTLGFCPGCQIS